MAITTIQTNADNDIVLPDGRMMVILSGAPALAQELRHAGLMRTGENIFDVQEGVDYMGTIFTSSPDIDLARQSIADAILAKPDVLSIESLDITVIGETFEYEANVMTIYGNQKVTQ